jgi:hypothetical protein
MRNLITVATLALVACGYSEDKYAEDFAAKFCEQQVECGGDPCEDGTTDTTGTTTTEPVDDTCEFDAKAAKECIDAAWDCTPEIAGFSFPQPADVCANVYVCDGTEPTTPTTEGT